MKARWIAFGEVEIEGRRYSHDLVIDAGRVEKRRKKPSKPYRDDYGHTPLSAEEKIPWGGSRLIVGTGASGSLPIMPAVFEEAERRGVEVVAAPTKEALRLLRDAALEDVVRDRPRDLLGGRGAECAPRPHFAATALLTRLCAWRSPPSCCAAAPRVRAVPA